MDISFYSDNLMQYMGTGLFFVLLLVGVLFLGLKLKDNNKKQALVWFPIYVLIIYFCPIWIVYMKLRDDGEILYRILWMIPVAVIVCYALVEAIWMIPGKKRALAFALSLLLIIVSGQYVYSNQQFHKAENVYHVPQAVVDICDTITVEGREIRACFPIEMIQYVRQYTSFVCQPYGRDTLLWGVAYDEYSTIAEILDEDVLDTKALAEELRRSDTPYLIVDEDTEFSESILNYDYSLVTNIDGYDIYLDNTAYVGAFD